jgi:hypothetical protein
MSIKELIFKDNKNNKYILEVKDNEILSEEYLKNEFKNQYEFDDKVINLYYNKQKNFNQNADILSNGDLEIDNIKHVKIDLGKTIITQNNDDEINNNVKIDEMKFSILQLKKNTEKKEINIPNDLSSIDQSVDETFNSFLNELSFFK